MALVRIPNPLPDAVGALCPAAQEPAPGEAEAGPIEAPSAVEENWLARLDEVFAETGWPDA